MSDKPPITIERLRDMYSWATGWRPDVDPEYPHMADVQKTLREEFDRALAAHDAEVLAAAGVAPQPEPEYEYGNQAMFHTHTPIMPAPDRETAMKRAWLHPAFRRVKAGAWEPAPTQEGEHDGNV